MLVAKDHGLSGLQLLTAGSDSYEYDLLTAEAPSCDR